MRNVTTVTRSGLFFSRISYGISDSTMSVSESVSELFSESTNNDNIFTIGATVDTGTLRKLIRKIQKNPRVS